MFYAFFAAIRLPPLPQPLRDPLGKANAMRHHDLASTDLARADLARTDEEFEKLAGRALALALRTVGLRPPQQMPGPTDRIAARRSRRHRDPSARERNAADGDGRGRHPAGAAPAGCTGSRQPPQKNAWPRPRIWSVRRMTMHPRPRHVLEQARTAHRGSREARARRAKSGAGRRRARAKGGSNARRYRGARRTAPSKPCRNAIAAAEEERDAIRAEAEAARAQSRRGRMRSTRPAGARMKRACHGWKRITKPVCATPSARPRPASSPSRPASDIAEIRLAKAREGPRARGHAPPRRPASRRSARRTSALRGEGCFDGKEWERERRPASAEEPEWPLRDHRRSFALDPQSPPDAKLRVRRFDQPGTIAISEKRMCAQKPLQLDFYQVL